MSCLPDDDDGAQKWLHNKATRHGEIERKQKKGQMKRVDFWKALFQTNKMGITSFRLIVTFPL